MPTNILSTIQRVSERRGASAAPKAAMASQRAAADTAGSELPAGLLAAKIERTRATRIKKMASPERRENFMRK
jgi:hypothetical protein